MPTLNIAGKRVTVGDDFLKLSPEDQQKTVNEIAGKIGISAPPPPAAPALSDSPPAGAAPGSAAYAAWAVQQAKAGNALPQVSQTTPNATSLPEQIMAGTSAAANALPIVGPAALQGLENARAAIQHMTPEQVVAETKAREQANPTASTIGEITGMVAPFALGASIPGVATVLGMDATTSLPVQMGLGGLTQAGISRLDSAVRGTPQQDADTQGAISALTGAAAPVLGKVLSKGAEKIGGMFKGMVAPAGRADDILANAARADVAAGRGMTTADEAAAALNGQPVINADRLGPNAQTLARVAANIDPTARQGLTEALNSRFTTQNARIEQFINRLTGGQTNALKAADRIDAVARGANDPAYRAAYNDPRAAGVLTVPADPNNPGAGDMLAPEIHQLMGAPEVQKAIGQAVDTGKTFSALYGHPPVANPFVFDKATGTYGWAPDAQLPSLQFWDHVQRNLRTMSKVAGRAGDDTTASTVWQLRTKLNNALDAAVPPFAQARSGAAAAFGAEDALEAGQKFVNMPAPKVADAIEAYKKFTPQEQRLFGTGFANDLIAKVNGRGSDSANLINKIFGSPQSRQQVVLALKPFAPDAADQLENFLRVENIMQGSNNIINRGSTTAAQLAGMGAVTGGMAGGVTGGGDPLDPTTWNWSKIASGAGEGFLGGAALSQLGKFGAKAIGAKINGQVMQSIAQKLASNDPSVISDVVKNAAKSKQASLIIKAIQQGVNLAARGVGMGLATSTAPAMATPPTQPTVATPALSP